VVEGEASVSALTSVAGNTSMATNATPEQEGSDTTVEKRAQYERFSMTVCANGVVNVRNDSYGEDSGSHIYSVNPADGSCTCPHHVYREAHCKHLTAVEDSPIVVSSAEAAAESYDGRVASDGGLPAITTHVEPEEVGGRRYARCENCGSESVEDAHGETSILHDDDCPRRDESDNTGNLSTVDPYPETEEVDTTPL
jgi:hypothetical protein